MELIQSKKEISLFMQAIQVLVENEALPKETQEKLEELYSKYKKSK